jgi:alpha-galactosidase
MVTAMLCRIHQSGRLDSIAPQVLAQVSEGIRIYKDVLRKHIPESAPFYPFGTSDVTDRNAPLTLGMRSPQQTVLGVWRIDGPPIVKIHWPISTAKLLYPTDLGIKVSLADGSMHVEFPRPHMACLIMA